MPISVKDQNAFLQAEVNISEDLSKSTGSVSPTQDAAEIAQMKAIVDNNQDSFSPSEYTAINNAYTILNGDFLGHASTEQTEKDLQAMVAEFANAKLTSGTTDSNSLSFVSQGADPYSPSASHLTADQAGSAYSKTEESTGLSSELTLEKEKGKIDPNDSKAMGLMQLSYDGYIASHPKTTLSEFAKQEAPKVGLTESQITNMVNGTSTASLSKKSGSKPSPSASSSASTKSLESKGAAAEAKLDAEKGKIDPNDKTSQGLMKDSYNGYVASHPHTTLSQFAKYEAPRVGLTASQVTNMINGKSTASTSPSKDSKTPSADSTASSHDAALAALQNDGGAMALGEGADQGKANKALTDQAYNAAKAGDKAAFTSAYNAIVKAMGGNLSGGSNQKVMNDLNTLQATTSWVSNPTQSSIAQGVQDAADAMGAGDWAGDANDPAGDVKKFMDDYNGGADKSLLQKDEATVSSDMNKHDLSTNLLNMMNEAIDQAGGGKQDVTSGSKQSSQQQQQTAISSFSVDGGAMALGEGAGDGKANQALTAQAIAAAKAGNQNAFDNAYNAIFKAMGGNQDGGSNAKVLQELSTISQNTTWNTQPTRASIADFIQHAADAMGSGDWSGNGDAGKAVAQFLSDWNDHASEATLSSDAASLNDAMGKSDLATNLSAMISMALNNQNAK